MKCPKCQNKDTKVIDSRIIDNGYAIRRRRECPVCGYRFTTIEKTQNIGLIVIKKDGSKETYDREKLKKAIMIAFAKRKFEVKQIDELLNKLETKRTNLGPEIKSTQIGDDVLDLLKEIDEVAYIRFASVYKSFQKVTDFLDLISKDFNLECRQK